MTPDPHPLKINQMNAKAEGAPRAWLLCLREIIVWHIVPDLQGA